MCYVGVRHWAPITRERVLHLNDGESNASSGPPSMAAFTRSASTVALAVAPASVFGVYCSAFMLIPLGDSDLELPCRSGRPVLNLLGRGQLHALADPDRRRSGALISGYVGEHIGLRASLAMAGLSAVV